ncbi:hypothetical protein LG311_01775 [Sutcliffiella horikoshii]|uniref:hypothetical protein n=1 Tax=Sutcliffiella horikoshii TaxID=79883 RepID=UPI00384DD7B8
MSHNFVFISGEQITSPLRVFFLCGSFYNKKNKTDIDKRIVLRDYIESIDSSYKCIILEDHFCFRKDKNLLNYNDINLKSLKDIELMTCLISDKILILHESFSTSTELGLFSADPSLARNILLLVPEYYSVEEDFISGFINLAFDNTYFKEYNIEKIIYYPQVKPISFSDHRMKYHTSFVNNEVPVRLKGILKDKLKGKRRKIAIKPNIGGLRKIYDNGVYFKVMEQKVNITSSPKVLYDLLFAMLNINSVIIGLRKCKNIFEVINYLKAQLNYILLNTMKYEGGYVCSSEIEYSIRGNIKYNDLVSYFVYVIIALGFITLPNQESKQLLVSMELKEIVLNYKSIIKEIDIKSNDLLEVLD